MKFLRKELRGFIRFFGYTGQSLVGEDGTPDTEFFDFESEELFSDEVEENTLSEINGYKRLNERSLSECGTLRDSYPSYDIGNTKDIFDF